jgi:signal transduction histidine kinase
LKSSNDLKSVHVPDDRHDRESGPANGDSSINTEFFLSEKDAEQHRGSLEETIADEDKFSRLTQMSRHLAHRLNNLLTTIMANTQLMRLAAKDEELKSYLGPVEDAAREAGTIVHEFQRSVKVLAELSSQEGKTQRSNRE